MNRTLIAVLAFVAWSAVMFGAGWAWRGDRAEGADARQQASASAAAVEQVNQTRATEHTQADKLAAIGVKHEEDRAAAPAVADAVVADVRAGDLRLRDGWASCETQRLSDAAAAAGERDAAAERRADFAGAVVRAGRDADDQLRACQAVIAADRAETP
ncbi:lysis system i-spanin subunit Rz [Stenotrophomonas sp. AS1]|uniref:lysis system i-spanin subunit Rz n=1 Tax=Stenotrophomonas sp. AS1 TaxID=3029188 RepID=UPI003B7E3555